MEILRHFLLDGATGLADLIDGGRPASLLQQTRREEPTAHVPSNHLKPSSPPGLRPQGYSASDWEVIVRRVSSRLNYVWIFKPIVNTYHSNPT